MSEGKKDIAESVRFILKFYLILFYMLDTFTYHVLSQVLL